VGPKKAEAIIAARPFNAVEDVMKVKGIKDGIFAKIKPFITVK
jgi:DNA uptake protein ComE-like DNA-binding protein